MTTGTSTSWSPTLRAGRSGPAEDGPADDAVDAVDADDEDDDDDDDDEEDDLTDPVAVALFDLLIELPAAEIAGVRQPVRRSPGRWPTATTSPTRPRSSSTACWATTASTTSWPGWWRWAGRPSRPPWPTRTRWPTTPWSREIAAAADPRYLGREDLLYVASHAYATVTGRGRVSFYEFVDASATRTARCREPPRCAGVGRDRRGADPRSTCPGCPSCSSTARCGSGRRPWPRPARPRRPTRVAWDDRGGRPRRDRPAGRRTARRTPPP